ncbi:MAG: hypothetical protein AAF513_13995 [Pseudomonadota bacterium]
MARRPLPGDIVSRRKGLVMHRGISLGDGRVLHNTPFRGEHICSEHEFRAGKSMYVTGVDLDERRRALRALDGERRRYNLLTNNCEHTVSRATSGRARSPQLRSWVVGAGLAAATFALTRHPLASAAAYAMGRKLAGLREGRERS